jgi:hypothetical protein
LPSPWARTVAAWVDEVVSLSRKADLPCVGSPAGRVPSRPLTERGAAAFTAPFNECDDEAMPAASLEFRGAAPALLTEIIAVISAITAAAATNDRRVLPLPGRLIVRPSSARDPDRRSTTYSGRAASVAALVYLPAAGA